MRSVEKHDNEAVDAAPTPTPPARRRAVRWYLPMPSPLWLCLLLALLARAWLIYHTHGVVDGDEALLGIQAEHILRGEHPIYFYGQAYMGSLEAYLVALLFAIVGPSVWALRAEPTLLSLLLVWLTWRLAGRLAEAAEFAPSARRMFQTVAALFAAMVPLYDMVVELKTLGGYIETFVLMLFLLLSVFQLTRRWHAGASNTELALRWLGIGFIVGLALWVNLLIISAILAATAWILGFCLVEGVHVVRTTRLTVLQTYNVLLSKAWLVIAALPALIVGLAPALYWGYKHQWDNLKYAMALGSTKNIGLDLQARYPNRLSLIHAQVLFYKDYIAPRVISGALPIENATLTRLHSFTFNVGVVCIVAALLLLALSLVWRHPRLRSLHWLLLLPLLFAFFTALTFCTSTASTIGLESFQHDLAGRYAAPLALALPFLFATFFTLPLLLLPQPGKQHVASSGAGTPAPQRTSAWRSTRLPLVLQAAFLVLLALYLGAQAYTYAQTDPAATFQSPSCPHAPINNDPIIAYLQQQHVHYAWAISWIGYPITFKTNDDIITADPRFVIAYTTPRYPAYLDDLLHADSPALLMFINSHDQHPGFLLALDALHITYRTMRFPSTPGIDVLVVTSLSRTVHMTPTYAFFEAFHNCI